MIVVLAIIAASSGQAFAASRHLVCEAQQHDCGTQPRISSCCCGAVSAPADLGVPAQARSEVASGIADVPAPPQFDHVAPVSVDHASIHTSPPGHCLVDLPTLFASLLI